MLQIHILNYKCEQLPVYPLRTYCWVGIGRGSGPSAVHFCWCAKNARPFRGPFLRVMFAMSNLED